MNPPSSEQVSELLWAAGSHATVYLVGAGGCGMSGLGHLLLDLGHRVVGSDLVANEEVRHLIARGAHIHVGHKSEQLIAAQPNLIVYSSAIRLDNAELQAAQQTQVPIVRRAVLLAALLHRQRGICVAGMHGKTTTTALLAFALESLKTSPSYAVGALVPQLNPHARFSQPTAPNAQPLFVIEADESDGTLREFSPACSIVLNVDEEHLDFYANLEAICREFAQFGQQTRESVIFCADDLRLAEIYASHLRAISYGFHPLSGYRIETKPQVSAPLSVHAKPSTSFEVWRKGERLGIFSIQLAGEKNISNAGAVIAMLHQLGFTPAEIAAAISGFKGAARRQQELFHSERFRLFDDYGHHPSEIQATLRALKPLGGGRLLVAFQPHRFTRTQRLLPHFATCFAGADQLWITEIYAASETEIAGVNGARLAEAIEAQGQAVEFIPTLAELRRSVRVAMRPGDLVLFLGAGDITKAAHELAVQLSEEMTVSKEQLFAQLSARLSADSIVRPDEPLAKRTTLRVGGKADFYVEPASEADLAELLKFCAEQRLPFLLLGRGSNLLIKDGGIRGVVICLSHPNFSRFEIVDDRLHCGAGVKLKTVSVEARRNGLAGLEFLEGIPGSVGGSLRMNAGAMGCWLFEVVETVRFMDYHGEVHERRASEVNVEYRGCPLFKNHIALSVVLKGQPAAKEVIVERMNTYSHKRWESQPAAPSAGCIFKNPSTIPAGKLIDELGLKGTRVGGAIISDVHGNFIVNDGHATAQDVLNLIEIVRQRAKSTRGIDLETEVQIIGE